MLQHITDKMGPIETASMGEEAIVLNFKGSNHILRLTPKRRMLDTVLNNQLVIDQVVRHHSICVGENNDIVLSVVPRLSVRIHDYTHLESVFNIIRNKYFDYQRGGVIFSDIKPENLGELPDGTPLVTDLGAIRKFKPTEAFEQMERQLDSYLDILNPGRKTASDLEWYIPTEAGPMHKQHFYFGDPAQSKLGHALSAAIEKMKEERLGYKPSLAV